MVMFICSQTTFSEIPSLFDAHTSIYHRQQADTAQQQAPF